MLSLTRGTHQNMLKEMHVRDANNEEPLTGFECRAIRDLLAAEAKYAEPLPAMQPSDHPRELSEILEDLITLLEYSSRMPFSPKILVDEEIANVLVEEIREYM